MPIEKPIFDRQKASEVALSIFLDANKGYFSVGALERSLKKDGCDKTLARGLATTVTRDIVEEIEDEKNQVLKRHLFSGLDLKLNTTTFVPQGSSSPVTLYYAQSTVKEAEVQSRYESEEQEKKNKQEDERKRREAEVAAQREAQRRPSDVVVSLVPYRSGASAQEFRDYIEGSDETADATAHLRLIPDKSTGYRPLLTSFISEDIAFRILRLGITPTDFAQTILLARARIIAETRDLLANSETIAQEILQDASTMTSSRRGITFFASTLLQRSYLMPVRAALEKNKAAYPNLKDITAVDPFYEGEFPYPVQAAYNWAGRYEDQQLTAYQEPLKQLLEGKDPRAIALQEVMQIPDAFARLSAGESISVATRATPLTREDVDNLLAPVILHDAYLTRGIFTDILRTGFLDRSYDEGANGELFALTLRELVNRFTPEEILDTLRFALFDTKATEQEIADIRRQVSIGQKGLSKLSGGKRIAEQKRLQSIQNQIPPLAQRLRLLQESNKHPVYDRLLLALRNKGPKKPPKSDEYDSADAFGVDEGIYELFEVFLPNY